MWGHGYQQVFVIAPNVVNSTRGRYRQSGARNDHSDAFVLADVLRTDRARLQPWKPDLVLTRQIRGNRLNERARRARWILSAWIGPSDHGENQHQTRQD